MCQYKKKVNCGNQIYTTLTLNINVLEYKLQILKRWKKLYLSEMFEENPQCAPVCILSKR